jgi:pantothenate kinase
MRQGQQSICSLDALVDEIVAKRGACQKRVIVSITGKPGSGKTTLASLLCEKMGHGECVHVPLDGFHLSNKVLLQRNLRGEKGSLATFDKAGFAVLLHRIKAPTHGDVFFPVFHREFEESLAAEGVVLPSHTVVVTEGIWLLHEQFAAIRDCVDISVFLDVDQELRIERLVRRGEELGKSREEAIAWATGPDEKNARIIETTRDKAMLLLTNNVK